MKKERIVYAAIFSALLVIEILIALFVKDDFVRPYVGDMLVTTLICCLCRVIIPKGVRVLPIYVFVFSAVVETMQHFDIVKLLGLENVKLISTVIGRTFSWMDLLCYAAGCFIFVGIEYAVNKFYKNKI